MPDFDDSKDKVRRNLVSFSASLLIAKFIGLHIKDLDISPIGKITSKLDHPENIRFTVIAIWIYLAYRFAASIEITTMALPAIRKKFSENLVTEKKNLVDQTILRTLKGKRTYLGKVTFKTIEKQNDLRTLTNENLIFAIKQLSPRIEITGKEHDPKYEYSLNRIEITLTFYATNDYELWEELMTKFNGELRHDEYPTRTIEDSFQSSRIVYADVAPSKLSIFSSWIKAYINTVFSPDFSEIIIGSLIGIAGGIAAYTFN